MTKIIDVFEKRVAIKKFEEEQEIATNEALTKEINQLLMEIVKDKENFSIVKEEYILFVTDFKSKRNNRFKFFERTTDKFKKQIVKKNLEVLIQKLIFFSKRLINFQKKSKKDF